MISIIIAPSTLPRTSYESSVLSKIIRKCINQLARESVFVNLKKRWLIQINVETTAISFKYMTPSMNVKQRESSKL